MAISRKINRQLLPCKVHYFLFAGGQAAVLPFIPVLAKHFGISPEVVGILYTILPMVPMISNPITGIIADKLRKLKLVMMISLAIFTVFVFSIMLLPLQPKNRIPPSTQDRRATDDGFLCTSNDSVLDIVCGDDDRAVVEPSIRFFCNLTCWNASLVATVPPCEARDFDCGDDEELSGINFARFSAEELDVNSTASCSQTSRRFNDDASFRWRPTLCSEDVLASDDDDENRTASVISNNDSSARCDSAHRRKKAEDSIYLQFPFWWLCFSTLVGWVSLGTVTCLTDAIILDNLGEKIDQFGRQRLWGTIGAGISVILTGYLNERATQRAGYPDYRLGFYVFIVFLTVDQYAIYRMEDSKQPKPQNIRKCITKLLRSSQIVLFLLAFFVIGVLVGILESFHFWYLEDLGANQLLLGLTRGMQLFGGEMPSFIISGWVINKIGYVNSVTMVLAVYGTRFIGYSTLVNPWVTLPLELTHAAYGIFYAAMAAYASVVAPPGMSATMQAIVGAMYEGAGIGFGSFLGGQLYGLTGGRTMFFGFGCIAIASSIFHGTLQLILSKYECGRTDIHGKPYKTKTTLEETTNAVPMETTRLNNAKDPHQPVDVRVDLNGTATCVVTSV